MTTFDAITLPQNTDVHTYIVLDWEDFEQSGTWLTIMSWNLLVCPF